MPIDFSLVALVCTFLLTVLNIMEKWKKPRDDNRHHFEEIEAKIRTQDQEINMLKADIIELQTDFAQLKVNQSAINADILEGITLLAKQSVDDKYTQQLQDYANRMDKRFYNKGGTL